MTRTHQIHAVADALEVATAYLKTADVSPATPGRLAILDAALEATGLREGWEAGSLDGRQALELLHAVRLEGRRLFRAWAEELLAEVSPDSTKALLGGVREAVGRFFGRMAKGIRELFAAGVLAVAGPDASVLDAPVVQEALEEQHARQMDYLDDFRRRIVTEARPLDGNFVATAEQYGASVWGGAQEVVRKAAAKGGIFDFEKRTHYGADMPCPTCKEQEALGWQPIGTLRAIGDSECRCQCHCGFSWRRGEDGHEHVAGRGPLHPQVFGSTG